MALVVERWSQRGLGESQIHAGVISHPDIGPTRDVARGRAGMEKSARSLQAKEPASMSILVMLSWFRSAMGRIPDLGIEHGIPKLNN